QQPVRARVERPTAARWRKRSKLAEAHLCIEAFRTRDAAGQHAIGAAFTQLVAGEFQRVERRCAGGIKREAAAAEVQRAGEQTGGPCDWVGVHPKLAGGARGYRRV